MKQNKKMLWFSNSTRRSELIKRKTSIILFSATNAHLAFQNPLVIKSTPTIGEGYTVKVSDIKLDNLTIEDIKTKYITCQDDKFIYGIEINGEYEKLEDVPDLELVCLA